METKLQTFQLEPKTELRFETNSNSNDVVFELKSGVAEFFGTDLVRNKPYKFRAGINGAVYTSRGCCISVEGEMADHYIAKMTSMDQYSKIHKDLEHRRQAANIKNTNGPIVMVVGPPNVGKSTLCQILLNYAARQGRMPILADLDVSHSGITFPGTIGSFVIDQPACIGDEFAQQAPLIHQFGHLKPDDNEPHYKQMMSNFAEETLRRMQANKRIRSSGIIINAYSWGIGAGYDHILHAAKEFQVSTIYVLGQDRLHGVLQRDTPSHIELVNLEKNCGAEVRCETQRMEQRGGRMKEYFFGDSHSFELKWSEISIFKVGVPDLHAACLPYGMKIDRSRTKLFAVQPSASMLHHVLALTMCDSIKDDIVNSNVACFMCVTKVNIELKTITLLSPQPRPASSLIFLRSSIKYNGVTNKSLDNSVAGQQRIDLGEILNRFSQDKTSKVIVNKPMPSIQSEATRAIKRSISDATDIRELGVAKRLRIGLAKWPQLNKKDYAHWTKDSSVLITPDDTDNSNSSSEGDGWSATTLGNSNKSAPVYRQILVGPIQTRPIGRNEQNAKRKATEQTKAKEESWDLYDECLFTR